jgi:hypothetical protein
MADLCPRCVLREQEPDEDGFCLPCMRARVVEHYAADDAERASVQGTRWKDRTGRGRTRTAQDREHDRLRQDRHRRLERLRPRESVTPGADPLDLAFDGLRELAKLRPAAKTAQAMGHLERVEEIVRRLGWGPGE